MTFECYSLGFANHMFTGIIGATGILQKVIRTRLSRRIIISTDQKIVRGISMGGSVAIDGVCLTVIGRGVASESSRRRSLSAATPDTLTFELMDSTLKRTTLGTYKAGDRVNVEAAVRMGQELGGHYLSGHVDGVGQVREIKKRGTTGYYTFEIPTPLARYLVPQGSIAINGVSLTIVEVGDRGRPSLRSDGGSASRYHNWFSVALTSYTRKHCNLGDLKVGDRINVEVDMMAKYIFKYLKHYEKLPHRRRTI